MPHFFRDGGVVSSNFMFFQKSGYFSSTFNDHSVCKARVEEVLYTDDPRNSTSKSNHKQVQYICTVIGGADQGQKLFNVTSTVPMGGQYNTGEVIHAANTTQDLSGTETQTPDKTQGAIVLIQFLHGCIAAPVITGVLKHPKSTVNTTKADGQRSKFSFNGMDFDVSKDGELTVTFGGGPTDPVSGQPPDVATAGTKMVFSKNGSVAMQDKDGNGMTIDPNAKTVGMNGVMMTMSSGGSQAARMNDLVIGTDSQGGPINAYIGVGSSNVLIGG